MCVCMNIWPTESNYFVRICISANINKLTFLAWGLVPKNKTKQHQKLVLCPSTDIAYRHFLPIHISVLMGLVFAGFVQATTLLRVHGCDIPVQKKPSQSRYLSCLVLTIFPPQLPRCSLSHGCRCCVTDFPCGMGKPQSLMLCILMGCGSNGLLQKEASLVRRASGAYRGADGWAEEN